MNIMFTLKVQYILRKKENGDLMYSYLDLFKLIGIANNSENLFLLKAIIHGLIKSQMAYIERQKIIVNVDLVNYLYKNIINLNKFFDYSYNCHNDIRDFVAFLVSDDIININAIFCPGYSKDGYKNRIGKNNLSRMKTLSFLKEFLLSKGIECNFKILLANIFLENTDSIKNPRWEDELHQHEQLFIETAKNYFTTDEIDFLSNIFPNREYKKGFILDEYLHSKTYDTFYKNNLSFYHKMGWSTKEIEIRNDKLFTIYNIISKYIKEQKNGIYIPMETMYFRSKVMTKNNVCTLYLKR